MIETHVNKRLSLCVIGLSLFIATPALSEDDYGNPFIGSGFIKEDWQVVCDNTLTCRAVGYSLNQEPTVSVLLTAIPRVKTPAVEVLAFPYMERESSFSIELWLNDKYYGQLMESSEGIYTFNKKQTEALLKLANQQAKIEIVALNGDTKQSAIISDKGMMAVLLKLDDAQNRVGTPLALVSRHNPNRQTPKDLKPVPKIYRGYSFPLVQGGRYEADENGKYRHVPNDVRYTKHISKSQKKYWQDNMTDWISLESAQEENMCEYIGMDDAVTTDGTNGWDFIPIDSQHTLAMHLCWGGAYNRGYGYWLFNNQQPDEPKLITTEASHYKNGEIYGIHKGRGIGDCWISATWTWNGNTFLLSEKSTSGLCRGFSGGAWSLPTFVSEVIENK